MRVTSFTETMRGVVLEDGRGVEHHAAARHPAARPLVLRRLHLRLRHPEPGDDSGYRGEVVSGEMTMAGFRSDRVSGAVEILVRESGRRIMRYRLVAESDDGRRVRIVGVKYLVAGLAARWRETTTLYVDVYEGGMDDLADAPTRTGVARVLVRDLIGQILSLRGNVFRFGSGFVRLLL